jgi:hypothetical protein
MGEQPSSASPLALEGQRAWRRAETLLCHQSIT